MSGLFLDGMLEVFDVDHGACALLTMLTQQGPKRVLIDCGHSSDFQGAPWYPGDQLIHRSIKHVDLLIVTNYDEDHVSGAPSLVKQGISVEAILGNPTVPPEAIEHLKSEDGMGNGIRIIVNSLSERRSQNWGTTVPDIPGVTLRWFWNPYPHWDNENNLSLVVHLSINGTNFLFTGDMEKDGFENLLRLPSFAQLMSGVHVLMAPHHGRENGRCETLFDDHGCRPDIVVISDCAKKYQSQETTQYYASKAKGIHGFRGQGPRYVLTTRRDGYLKFVFESGRCYAR